MSENKHASESSWVDPDDAPEWTEEMFEEAELTIGGQIIKPGKWRTRGRPPLGNATKRQVTLRIDPDVIDCFKADGPGWQGRMNAALRRAAGLS